MSKIVKGIVLVLAVAGFVFGVSEAYKGVKWIRAAHSKGHLGVDWLATGVGTTTDGRAVNRADYIDKLIQDDLKRNKQ